MTPKLQQLLDSLAARNVQKIRLIEGEKAQVWKDGAWTPAALQVTPELLDALDLENGARELQTNTAKFRAEIETVGETRQITLTNLGATSAQLKATLTAPTAATPLAVSIKPPPLPLVPRAGEMGRDAKIASDKVGDFKIVQNENVRNVGARVGELKSVPLPDSAVPAEPVAPVAPAKQQWFYANDGEQIGPKARVALQSLIMGGTITRDTLLWREGLPGWIAASESEFAASLPAAAPVNPVPVSPASNVPEYRDLGLDFSKERDRSATLQGFGALASTGVLIALCIGIPVTLNNVRNGNRRIDLSSELEPRVRARDFEADDVTLKRTDTDHYEGNFVRAAGDKGWADVDITERDWLGRASQWKIATGPIDFSRGIARQIENDDEYQVTVSLDRLDATNYSGTKQYYRRETEYVNGREIERDVPSRKKYINVRILSFNAAGEPTNFNADN